MQTMEHLHKIYDKVRVTTISKAVVQEVSGVIGTECAEQL